MPPLRHLAASLALCLMLASSPAAADSSSSALKVVGAVVTAVGLWTGNADLIKVGYGLMTAGDACGRNVATQRLRRRRESDAEGPVPLALAHRSERHAA